MAYKTNTLFDVLENILKTKSMDVYRKHVGSEGFKDASGFMMRRYLSMHENRAVREVILENWAALERLPDRIVYLWCLKNVPKQSKTFIKYLR